MKFKLYYCPICEKRIDEMSPTLWLCKECKQAIELSVINYSSEKRTMTLEYLFTEVDKDGRLPTMQGRNRSTTSEGS